MPDSTASGTISIHALRGEGDAAASEPNAVSGISIHALRGEGDRGLSICSIPHQTFLSTPSVGRATTPTATLQTGITISIHALRGEGDELSISGL